MASLKIGIIVRFISDSVLSGFTTAAGILIASSQFKHLLGMSIPRVPFFSTLGYILTHLTSINLLALVVGIGGIFLLSLFKDFNKKLCKNVPLPEQLLLLALATFVSWLFDLEETPVLPPAVSMASSATGFVSAAALNGTAAAAAGGGRGQVSAMVASAMAAGNATAARRRFFSLAVVGDVPSGLPRLIPPPLSFDLIGKMMYPALVVGVFSFILSISIVRTFALQYEYETDSNQELYALGVANIAGAFFLSYPVAGSLSRSALVSTSAQAHCTPLHGVFTTLLVVLTLLVLTPAFYPMPRTCLASIVFMAVKSLFDVKRPKFLYKVKRSGVCMPVSPSLSHSH